MEKSVKERSQIKKMSTQKSKMIHDLPQTKVDQIEGLIDAIEAAGVEEFIEYIKSPWKMLWPNFVAGVARGFGALVGAAIVVALIGWILSTIIDLPLIGKQMEPYVEKIQSEFRKYTEATNYKSNFEHMESTLTDIRAELRNLNKKEQTSQIVPTQQQ